MRTRVCYGMVWAVTGAASDAAVCRRFGQPYADYNWYRITLAIMNDNCQTGQVLHVYNACNA